MDPEPSHGVRNQLLIDLAEITCTNPGYTELIREGEYEDRAQTRLFANPVIQCHLRKAVWEKIW
jgi:hypothetical protein